MGQGPARFAAFLFSIQWITPASRRSSFVGDFDVRFTLEPARHRQLLLAQKIRVEQFRLVARAVVSQDRHDGVAGAELLGEADGTGDVDAGRAAEAQPLVLEQIEDDRYRFGVGDLIGGVDRRIFQVLGDAALADAFGDRGALRLQHAGRVVAVERGAHRIGKRDAHGIAARFERHRDAGERAAGADGADKAIDLAVGLPPDFRSRGFGMAPAIGDVVELIGPDRAVLFGLGQLRGEPAGDFDVIVGIGIGHGRHFDQFGTAQPQRVLLLLALGLRDHDHAAETHGIANQRQPDAGIAGGAFDDDAARPQLTLLHRVLDDEQRGAVLDRLARIHEFGLAQNGTAGRRRYALEPDQRGVADRLDNPVTNLHFRHFRSRATLDDQVFGNKAGTIPLFNESLSIPYRRIADAGAEQFTVSLRPRRYAKRLTGLSALVCPDLA